MNCPVCASELDIDATFCGACGFRMRARRGSLVGSTLADRYRVEARIASGGFGAIYRGTHLATGGAVALKVLHADLASDANLAARFRREGATLSSLRSPNTVSTYETGESDDGTLFIAMELLRGESLHDRFRVFGALGWRSVLTILRGVCASLVEAHGLGIVHRDLKPANIHLEPEPAADHVKVLDFGIAKLMSGSVADDGTELTRVGTAVGTLDYMAPEQLVGQPADGRTDIYTLGVVAYEMITGQRPFADATGPTSLITALFTRAAIPPSKVAPTDDVPAAVDVIVLRCLERDPANRYATVQELDAALAKALAIPEQRTTLVQSLADAARDDSSFAADEVTVRDRPIANVFENEVTAPAAPLLAADERTVVEPVEDVAARSGRQPRAATLRDRVTSWAEADDRADTPNAWAAGTSRADRRSAPRVTQPGVVDPLPSRLPRVAAEERRTPTPAAVPVVASERPSTPRMPPIAMPEATAWPANLTQVWPPVLPAPLPRGKSPSATPFELADGSTVGPAPQAHELFAAGSTVDATPIRRATTGAEPLAQLGQPAPRPSRPSYARMDASGTRLPESPATARVMIAVLLLLAIGGALGAAIAYL